jgi:hypothetical protein
VAIPDDTILVARSNGYSLREAAFRRVEAVFYQDAVWRLLAVSIAVGLEQVLTPMEPLANPSDNSPRMTRFPEPKAGIVWKRHQPTV